MFAILSENPLLTFFLVVAVGAALGQVRFGSVRLGAAGALFVGLGLSILHPQLGSGMELLQAIGLALFVYTVGLAAGATFMSQLRSQTPLIVLASITAVAGAGLAVVLGRVLSLPAELTTGVYTGALTAAPALDSALRISGNTLPGAGYAVGYPFGVVLGIIVVSWVVSRPWPGGRDSASMAGSSLVARTVRVHKRANVRDVPAWRDQRVRASYLRREDETRVVVPGEDLLRGDLVVFVGQPQDVEEAGAAVGVIAQEHLADDRSDVEFERIRVSNPDIAGRCVAELNLPVRFGAVLTRVRRGDLDLLASDELVLQPGDSVAVAVPTGELKAVAEFFGDSERQVSEVSTLALGVGLVLGMALGLVSVPLPGGGSFSLGGATGALIVGLVLGGLRRTGTLVWSMPHSANLTIRQLGMLFFLAALGLGAGPEFKSVATTDLGWKLSLVGVVVVAACLLVIAAAGRWLDLSAPRAAGAVAGFLGQPAVLDAAASRRADERIEAAYAALFAVSIVVKIVAVPVVYALAG
ncbi:MAG: TrkA C-terminal domain-containing protein [Actinomycetaceae bacterium]|nr:TrkA C-terminal domain-containing protein [Actinomycetaceae bacterium]